jgi:ketose-bisphosphate aldolase
MIIDKNSHLKTQNTCAKLHVPALDLFKDAEKRKYALGFFETWDFESTLAVVKAAENKRSPVIIGYSGIYFSHPERVYKNYFGTYARMLKDIAANSEVPVLTIYNESPDYENVLENLRYGYDIVMFTNENLNVEQQTEMVAKLVKEARNTRALVEGEIISPIGIGSFSQEIPSNLRLTDAGSAVDFIEKTGIDLFAVNIGQVHIHGKKKVNLNINKLKEIKSLINIPLVLHGMSSTYEDDVREAILNGIRKVNVGSLIKQVYFESIKKTVEETGKNYNPYQLVGSGQPTDVITKANMRIQEKVEKLIDLFMSSNKA